MSRLTVILLIAALALFGCGQGPAVKRSDLRAGNLYFVTFEGNPKVVEGKPVVRGNLELGRVLAVSVPGPKVTVAQIGVYGGNENRIRGNVSFYLLNGQLHYAELSASGKLLKAGAKILGFAGKAQLYWFKSKAPVNEVVKIAQSKAEKLYRQAAL